MNLASSGWLVTMSLRNSTNATVVWRGTVWPATSTESWRTT